MILELSDCPRCHSHATGYAMRFTREGTQYAIGCSNKQCNVSTTFLPMSIEDVARRWNEGIGLVRCGETILKGKQSETSLVVIDV